MCTLLTSVLLLLYMVKLILTLCTERVLVLDWTCQFLVEIKKSFTFSFSAINNVELYNEKGKQALVLTLVIITKMSFIIGCTT